MKPLLLLALLLASPAAGIGETVYSSRVYRGPSAPIQRVTTVRTTMYPSFEVYRSWDRGRVYRWNDQRYHWDGSAWVVYPGVVYSQGGGFGPSSTLQDDVGIDNTRYEEPVTRIVPRYEGTVTRTVTRVDVDAPTFVDVQRRLAQRGYYRGPIDGIVGPGTRSAIANFQVDHGQEPNGLVTQRVIDSLGL